MMRALRLLLVVLLIFFAIFITSCGGGGGSGGNVGGGIPPGTPTGMAASGGDGQVAIIWNSVSGATSYNIYFSTTSGVNKSTGTMISSVSSPYLHLGRINNTPYYYIVTATTSSGESSESSQVIATPQVGATCLFTSDATNITDNSVTIGGSFYSPIGYVTTAWIEYGTTTSYGDNTSHQGPYGPHAIINAIQLSYNVSGLQERTTYHYRTVTQNSAGIFYGINKTFRTYITPTTLASANSPSSIAVDTTNVYWAGDNSINKISTTGGTVTNLASSTGAIAIDCTSVYWADTTGGAIKKVGINGGAVSILAAGLSSPSYIAVDNSNVYWADAGAIRKVGVNGGSIMSLASIVSYPYAIAVDSLSVYWADGPFNTGLPGGNNINIKKIGKNGGSITTLASGLGFVGDIAIDNTKIYWAGCIEESGTHWEWEYRDPPVGPGNYLHLCGVGGAIKYTGINGGGITAISSDPDTHSDSISVDSTYVYYFRNYQTVNKVRVNGGDVETLAVGYPVDIAADSNSVYWTDKRGFIMKVPKGY